MLIGAGDLVSFLGLGTSLNNMPIPAMIDSPIIKRIRFFRGFFSRFFL